MIIYEMNMLYGDFFDAFLEKRQGLNFPTFFATACGSEPHADWWLYNKRENLKAKHIVGKLQVAGFSVLPEEVPQDVMEQSPSPPQLGGGHCAHQDVVPRPDIWLALLGLPRRVLQGVLVL